MVALSSSTAPKGGPDATFGTLLRQLRVAAGLTQEELAERASVSVKGISSLERGVNHAPHKDTLLMLARALDLTSSDQAALMETARRTRRLGGATCSTRAFAPQAQQEARAYGSETGIRGNREDGAWCDERRSDRVSARLDFAEPINAYRVAIRRWDTVGAVEKAAQTRVQLGHVFMRAARYDEALDVLLSAATIYRARGDADRLLHTLARIGETHALRGTPVEGIAILSRLDALQARSASLVARAATDIALAWLINCTGSYTDALPVAARAMELAAATAHLNLQVQAALRYGHLLLMAGELDRGMRALHDVLPLAMASGDLRSLRLALNTMGWAHELRGDLAHDQMYTERAYQAALDLGDPSVIAFMVSNHGGPAFNSGDWTGARADFERGLALSGEAGDSWASPWALVLLGQLDVVQGDDVRGERRLVEGSVLAQRNGDLQARRWAQGTLAERDLLRGEPQAAHRRLAPIIDSDRPHDVDEYVLIPLLAWAALDMGQESRAATLLDLTLAYATANQLVPTTVSALRVRGLLRQRQGKSAQAKDDLRDALALSEAIQQPYYRAKVHLTQAHVGSADDDADQSREYARTARAILAPLGERMYATQADGLLA